VANSLTKKGFDIFLPTYKSIRQWKDRKKSLLLPLFPCYVFIRNSVERHLEVVTTPGVWYIVTANGQPAGIPSAEIEQIRRVMANAPRLEPHPFLTTGDRVRVKAGPLVGVEGILLRQKGGDRLVLSLELLGRSAALEMDVALVEPVLDNRRAAPVRTRELQGADWVPASAF
jgi:transcription antitermination factor NusG